MIRSLPLTCYDCNKDFIPNGALYYRDDFLSNNIRDVKFVCENCIANWEKKWNIETALFSEKDYVLTVTIVLKDGTVYENLDCTPLENTVVTSEDIPVTAQKILFNIYHDWDISRKKNLLKNCFFKDEHMKTTFSCETYDGEIFTDVNFRFNFKGNIETEIPIPEYILQQVIDAYNVYVNQNKD